MRWLNAALVAALFTAPLTARAQDEGVDDSTGSQWAAEPPPPVPQAEPAASEPAQPAAAPTLNDFHAALDPYGRWVEVPGLGLVWQPSAAVVGADFTPYVTGGSWVSAPRGWIFQSQWDWGWAPFHYGRWTLASEFGWVWWPDTRWGPSWVDWRYSGSYVAWAPLPPPGFGLTFALGVPGWSYVPYGYFGRPRFSHHVIYPRWGAPAGEWGAHRGWGWSSTPDWRGGHRGSPPSYSGGGSWHSASPHSAPAHSAPGRPGGGGHRGGGGRGGGGRR
jgi:hypothetical protein